MKHCDQEQQHSVVAKVDCFATTAVGVCVRTAVARELGREDIENIFIYINNRSQTNNSFHFRTRTDVVRFDSHVL